MDDDFALFEKLYSELHPKSDTPIAPKRDPTMCCGQYMRDDECGGLVCVECGLTYDGMYALGVPSSENARPRDVRKVIYSRFNTYQQHLDILLGRVSLSASDNVRLAPLRKAMRGLAIDYHLLKSAMKSLNMQGDYDLIPCIMREWYGINPLTLTTSEIYDLNQKFLAFEDVFLRQKKRKNFLNYHWLIQRFLTDMGVPWERICNLPCLKDPKKSKAVEVLYQQILES